MSSTASTALGPTDPGYRIRENACGKMKTVKAAAIKNGNSKILVGLVIVRPNVADVKIVKVIRYTIDITSC